MARQDQTLASTMAKMSMEAKRRRNTETALAQMRAGAQPARTGSEAALRGLGSMLLGGRLVGPYVESTPAESTQPRVSKEAPPWFAGIPQFAATQLMKALAERKQAKNRVPSWRMPHPMPATAGEREVLGMLPVAGDVEDMRYLAEGVHEGDPAKIAMGGAAAALPFVPASVLHTVYHGSPHIFDAFKMSQIGTGEGAQAYGHGLYFAEEPGVAGQYREALSGGITDILGTSFSASPEKWTAGQISAGISEGQIKQGAQVLGYEGDVDVLLDAGKRELEKAKQAGALYKVEIPDEAVGRMLDWDKPLSEQPENVRSAIESRLNPNENMFFDGERWIPFDDMRKTGRSLYETVARFHGQEVASDILRQAGIPGIRYLDQMSRGGGEGTRNLVLFDESLAKILERK